MLNTHFTEFSNILIGLLLWTLVIVPFIILPFLIPLTVLRIFVHFLARKFRPDLIPITNSLDNFMTLSPSFTKNTKIWENNVTQIWRIQGKLDAIQFRKHFKSTFLICEESRKKYINLFCYFVQWNFYTFKKPVQTINLSEQIKECRLTSVEVVNLEQFIANWMSSNDYDVKKPKWQILICHIDQTDVQPSEDKLFESKDHYESILLFKIDHGLCDGYSMIHLTDKLTGIQSPYIVKDEKFSAFDQIKLFLSYPKLAIIDIGLNWAIENYRISKISKSTNSTQRLISFASLDLQKIKKVRQLTQTHFNTVLAVIQVGALRRYLIETDRISSEDELPQCIPTGTPEGMSGHYAMTHGGMTNHFSQLNLNVPIRTIQSAKDRLVIAEQELLQLKKHGTTKAFMNFYTILIWPLPSFIFKLLSKFTFHFKISASSFIISPQMFSNQPYQLLGHPVDHIYMAINTMKHQPWFKMYTVPVSNAGRMDLSVYSVLDIFQSQTELDWFTQVLFKEELKHLLTSCQMENHSKLQSHLEH